MIFIINSNIFLFLFQLFTSCRLIERILDAWDTGTEASEVDEETKTKKLIRQRKGYMGHLTKIANTLVRD